MSAAGLPWRTKEEREEFIQAVAEAVARALPKPAFVVDKNTDLDTLESMLCEPGKVVLKK